jgi:plasmid stability protein
MLAGDSIIQLVYINVKQMASLSVRKLDDKIVDKLRARAIQHGVSMMGEEVRRIIEQAVSNPTHLGDMATQYFGTAHGMDFVMPEHKPHGPIDLSE